MTITYKDWHEMLPFALMACQTSIKVSLVAFPYSLVYGTEEILLVEVEVPSFKVLSETNLAETEWVKKRMNQLNLIDEKRLATL